MGLYIFIFILKVVKLLLWCYVKLNTFRIFPNNVFLLGGVVYYSVTQYCILPQTVLCITVLQIIIFSLSDGVVYYCVTHYYVLSTHYYILSLILILRMWAKTRSYPCVLKNKKSIPLKNSKNIYHMLCEQLSVLSILNKDKYNNYISNIHEYNAFNFIITPNSMVKKK